MSFFSAYRIRFILLTGFIVFSSIVFLGYEVFIPKINSLPSNIRFLYIKKGTTYEQLIDELEEKNIVSSIFSFKLNAKLFGLRNRVCEGRYELKPGMSINKLVRLIKNGQQSPVNLVIRKFRTKEEFVHFISQKLEIDSSELLSLLNDSTYQKNNFGWKKEDALSLFTQNTFQFYWNTSAKDFMNRMKSEYDKFWNNQRLEKAKQLGFTPAEITTIASIVDEETNIETDKLNIAAVYINRLRKKMKLEADPTIKFAMNRFDLKRIYLKQTKFESPYNTYLNEGLPPGLICIPSASSIDAVLAYSDKNLQNDFLYFCASPYRFGYSDFAKTYDQQKKNAKRYQHYLDSLNIH